MTSTGHLERALLQKYIVQCFFSSELMKQADVEIEEMFRRLMEGEGNG